MSRSRAGVSVPALRGTPTIEVVAECGDGETAVSAIKAVKPDLVFLDVRMPGIDGFGVLERLAMAQMPETILRAVLRCPAL